MKNSKKKTTYFWDIYYRAAQQKSTRETSERKVKKREDAVENTEGLHLKWEKYPTIIIYTSDLLNVMKTAA